MSGMQPNNAATPPRNKFNKDVLNAVRAAQERNAAAQKPAVPAPDLDHTPMFGEPVVIVCTDKVVRKTLKEIFGIEFGDHRDSLKYIVHSPTDFDKHVRHLIPKVDEQIILDPEYTFLIAECLENDKVGFSYGPPGTGKTKSIPQVCARLNYPYMPVAGMGGLDPSDFAGSPWLKDNGAMDWKDGPVATAVRYGVCLAYDEPFKSSAQTNMCFQSLLDDRRVLNLYGHPDPMHSLLKAHKNFRCLMSDNVRGFGDQMDKFAAEVQDQSFLNRVDYIMYLDYMDPEREKSMLHSRFPEAKDKLIDKVVLLANTIRTGWKGGEIKLPFSLRDSILFVESALKYRDVAFAFKSVYYNGIQDVDEQVTVKNLYATVKFEGYPL